MSKRGMVTLCMAVCLVLAAFYVREIRMHEYQLTIADQIVHAPSGWRVVSRTGFGSKVVGDVAIVDIVDRRAHPDRPETFVADWKAKSGHGGFRSFRIDEYHDGAVDQTNMRCVALRSMEPIPLLLYCTSSAGHWRLTLDGHDSDIGGLDSLAKQLASLGYK